MWTQPPATGELLDEFSAVTGNLDFEDRFEFSLNATWLRPWNVIRRLNGRGMIYLGQFSVFRHVLLYLMPDGDL